jgi:hypothetical protein
MSRNFVLPHARRALALQNFASIIIASSVVTLPAICLSNHLGFCNNSPSVNGNLTETRLNPRVYPEAFNQDRHLYSRTNFKLNRAAALAEWCQLLSA